MKILDSEENEGNEDQVDKASASSNEHGLLLYTPKIQVFRKASPIVPYFNHTDSQIVHMD